MKQFIDIDKWQEIFQSIQKHKLRAVLTAFGVFWGIFMLVVLMGAGTGLENGATSNFDIEKNAVFVWTQRTSIPYKGLQPGRFIQLENEDRIAVMREVPEAAVVAPRMGLGGNILERGEESASFSVYGDYPNFLKIKPLIITKGRFINDLDIEEKRKIVVIGKRVQEVLFKPEENPIGEYIEIKGIPFKVVGTFASRSKGDDGIEDVQSVYIPLTSLQQAFNRPNRIGWFALLPQEGISASVVEQKTKSLLAERHLVAPEDKRAFGSANIEEEFREVQMIFIGIRGFSWLVAIGTIIAGVVGVGNIMMIIVKERTKEIGIRKSLGATPRSIVMMILQEAMVLTSIAGYIGLILGCALVEIMRYAVMNFGMESQFFSNPQIDFGTALTAVIVLIIAGGIAGLIPGLRAANVNPVIALRTE